MGVNYDGFSNYAIWKMRKPIALNCVRTLVRRYNTCTHDGDRYLYQIGRAVGELTEKDLTQIYGGELTPLMRSKVLSWLRQNTKQFVGF